MPTVADRLNSFVGKKFTNPTEPARTPETNISYTVTGRNEPIFFYRAEAEGVNKRYYISTGSTPQHPCRYSLLVNPDDVILSWRNEGSKNVDHCYTP